MDDFEEQFAALVAAGDQAIETMKVVARMGASHFTELLTLGLERDEALMLTSAVIVASIQSQKDA